MSRPANNAARSSLMSFGAGDRVAGVRIAEPGHRRDRVAHLRRQHVRVALADEDQRLAAFLERAHVHDERLERRQRHLVADLLDRLGRVVRVLLFELVLRRVVELPAEELLQRRARSPSGCASSGPTAIDSSGYITPIMSDGPSCVSTNCASWLAHRHARAAAHVVVVQEDREQPHVVARRFRSPRRSRCGSAFGGSLIASGGAAVELDQLEGLDLLRLAVLGDVEVRRPAGRATGLPFLSETMTSTRTKLMPVRKTGGCAGADRSGGGCAGCCAAGFAGCCCAVPLVPRTSSSAAPAARSVRIRMLYLRRFRRRALHHRLVDSFSRLSHARGRRRTAEPIRPRPRRQLDDVVAGAQVPQRAAAARRLSAPARHRQVGQRLTAAIQKPSGNGRRPRRRTLARRPACRSGGTRGGRSGRRRPARGPPPGRRRQQRRRPRRRPRAASRRGACPRPARRRPDAASRRACRPRPARRPGPAQARATTGWCSRRACSAQYPERANTAAFGRFTRTVTLWNLPSSGCGDSYAMR